MKNVHNERDNPNTKEVPAITKSSFICLPYLTRGKHHPFTKTNIKKSFARKFWAKIYLRKNENIIKVSNYRKNKREHRHGLVYHAKSPECNEGYEDYIHETGRGLCW